MSSPTGGAAGIALGIGATGAFGAGTASGIGGGTAAGRRKRRIIFARAPCGFVFLTVRRATLRVGFRLGAFGFGRFFFDGAFARAFFLRAGAALRFGFGFRFAFVFRPRRPVAM
jgi:hypothetical protein